MAHDLTQEELAGLTPEELEGIESSDDDLDPIILKDIAQDKEDVEDDAGTETKEAVEEKGGEAAKEEAKAEPVVPVATPKVESLVDISVEVPDHKEFLEDAQRRYSEALIEGDADTAAQIKAEIDDKLMEIAEARAINRANELSKQKAEQQSVDDWNKTVGDFLSQHKEYSPGNPILWGALDAQIKHLAQQPELAHLDGKAIIEKAHAEVQKQFNRATEQPEGKKVEAPKASRPDIKTLGNVPTAASNDNGDGEFSHLDKLKGEDLENAMAKMSEDQRRRYLAS